MTYSVRFTENFDGNLESIRNFLDIHDLRRDFHTLLAHLFDDIVPNLRRFPRMGRDFLSVKPNSDDGKAQLAALRTRTGSSTQIREYITGDYLILYAIDASTVFLLSIRHHLQLSFDLKGHWV